MSRRHGLRSFSAKRRRTVSCDRLSCAVGLTIASASSFSVQRARPAGGLEQVVATSRALSARELALRAGCGSSLSARSRLPSTKRRLVRYTVEPPTPTTGGDLVVADARIRRQQDLRPLELPRRLLAFPQKRPKFIDRPSFMPKSRANIWPSSTPRRRCIAGLPPNGRCNGTSAFRPPDDSRPRTRRPHPEPSRAYRAASRFCFLPLETPTKPVKTAVTRY